MLYVHIYVGMLASFAKQLFTMYTCTYFHVWCVYACVIWLLSFTSQNNPNVMSYDEHGMLLHLLNACAHLHMCVMTVIVNSTDFYFLERQY